MIDKEKSQRRRLAVQVYDNMFSIKVPGRPFLPPAQIQDMISFGKGKYMGAFDKVCTYLEDFMKEFDARNDFKEVLRDYFTMLFNHYGQYKRVPTLKQLSGPRIEDLFRHWVFGQEKEFGAYWVSEKEKARGEFNRKYGWGKYHYDPILPHLWSGPGDPSKVPELNRRSLPIQLGFRELLKYRLINPPQEDIDEYNRLFVEDPEDNRWVGDGNPTPAEKPGAPKRVSQKPVELRNKFGITRVPLITAATPSPTPPRVQRLQESAAVERVQRVQYVPVRTPPSRAKQADVPKRISTGQSQE